MVRHKLDPYIVAYKVSENGKFLSANMQTGFSRPLMGILLTAAVLLSDFVHWIILFLLDC